MDLYLWVHTWIPWHCLQWLVLVRWFGAIAPASYVDSSGRSMAISHADAEEAWTKGSLWCSNGWWWPRDFICFDLWACIVLMIMTYLYIILHWLTTAWWYCSCFVPLGAWTAILQPQSGDSRPGRHLQRIVEIQGLDWLLASLLVGRIFCKTFWHTSWEISPKNTNSRNFR